MRRPKLKVPDRYKSGNNGTEIQAGRNINVKRRLERRHGAGCPGGMINLVPVEFGIRSLFLKAHKPVPKRHGKTMRGFGKPVEGKIIGNKRGKSREALMWFHNVVVLVVNWIS